MNLVTFLENQVHTLHNHGRQSFRRPGQKCSIPGQDIGTITLATQATYTLALMYSTLFSLLDNQVPQMLPDCLSIHAQRLESNLFNVSSLMTA